MSDDSPRPKVTAEQVVLWMQATGGSKRDAATHFGVPYETVRTMLKRARKRAGITAAAPAGQVVSFPSSPRVEPPLPAAPRVGSAPTSSSAEAEPDPVSESPLQFWERKLREIDRHIMAAGSKAAGPLYGQALKVRREFERAKAEEEARRGALGSEEERAQRWLMLLRQSPDVRLQAAIDIYAERHNVRVVFVTADGREFRAARVGG